MLDPEQNLFSADRQPSDLQQRRHNACVHLCEAPGGGWIIGLATLPSASVGSPAD